MAFGSISDILLKITGDESDAADAIDELAAKLAIFAKESVEAEAKVDTSEARKDLDELRARLERIDLEEATPQVRVKIAEALVDIGVMEHELDKIDGRDVNVDVDVSRGSLERLGAFGNSLFGLSKRVRGLAGESEGLASSFSDVGVVLGPFTSRLGELGPILLALAPLIVALGGAVVALAGSLGAAVAALGALGVAAGGVFAVGIGFAFAAIARFKDEADTAGTPANALKTAFQGIGNAAKALLPAVDPVFKAMASGLNALKPLIGFLAPAFKSFGQAAANSVQSFVNVLASPAIAVGISNLIKLAGGALKPAAQIAATLFQIFLNIAQAAMPFLVQGLQDAAGALKGIGDATSNVSTLHGQIGGLVDVLGQWLQLLGAIGDILLSVLSASAGPGTQLVAFFTKGAQALADWVKSSEGQDRIKQFFADTLPLVQQVVELVAQLIVVFVEVGQILAPILTPTVAILNLIVGAVRELLAAFLSLPEPVRSALAVITALIIGFFTGVDEVGAAIVLVVAAIKLISLAVTALGGIWGPVAAAGVAAFHALVAAAGAVVGALTGAAGGVASAALAIGHAIVAGINVAASIPGRVGGFVSAMVGRVAGAVGSAASAAANIGRGILRGIALVSGIVGRVGSAIAGALGRVVGAVGGFVSAASRIGRGVVQGVASGIGGLAGRVTSALHGAASAARSFVGDFGSIGRAIIEAMARGVADAAGSLADAAANAVKGALDKAKGLLPGSEPKDPSSPMRRLDKSGAAIILNMVKGIEQVGPQIAAALSDQLTPAGMASLSASSSLPSLREIVSPAGGRTQINNFNVEVPGGEAPDAASMLAQVDMRLRTRGQWS